MRKRIPAINRWPAGLSSAVVSVTACFLDAQIDPYATEMGFWEWNSLYTQENSFHWFGVPLVNYVGWFSVIFSLSFFYFLFEGRKKPEGPHHRTIWLTLLAPAICLQAWIITILVSGILEGFSGPTWLIIRGLFQLETL